jgi:hypothetical protein
MSVTSASALPPPAPSTELGHAIYELMSHQIALEEFAHRFMVSWVYALCPVSAGLFVMSRPDGAAVVPVWSTVRGLRKVMGNYDWSASLGEDLVEHLPDGVTVLIDDGMPCPVLLPSALLSRIPLRPISTRVLRPSTVR